MNQPVDRRKSAKIEKTANAETADSTRPLKRFSASIPPIANPMPNPMPIRQARRTTQSYAGTSAVTFE